MVDLDPAPQTDTPNVADFDCHDDDVQDHITIDYVDDNDDVVSDFGEPRVPLRRSSRQRLPSTHYSSNEYMLLADGGEPECYEEAMESEHKNKWIADMDDEMKSLHDNHTFELVKLPKGMKTLQNRRIYRLKTEENGSTPRYKARLVVKGYR